MIRKILLIGVAGTVLLCATAQAAENRVPVVSNVTASQRGDGSNIVDIYYDLADADGDPCAVYVLLSNNAGETWGIRAFAISGDMGANIAPGRGKHVVWNVGADAPGLVGDRFKARVIADDGKRQQGEMCLVEAGSFRTSTGVLVHLDSYLIDKYEVTNQFYCLFLNAGGSDDHWRTKMTSEIERNGIPGSYTYRPKPGYDQRPVRYVTWDDAVALCDWRSIAEARPAGTFHLPTEAQWEKAAGWNPAWEELSKYAVQSDSISSTKANYNRVVGRTTDVGSYPYTSYYGSYDMSGNVGEWCADWWAFGPYPTSYANPTGPSTGMSRVFRGGAWHNNASICETGSRSYYAPSNVYSIVGFRCARALE